jgi:hypothetical protein
MKKIIKKNKNILSFIKYLSTKCNLLVLLILTFTSYDSNAQNTQVIKVRKINNSFFFFQKGNSNDSIISNSTNEFYLLVNDSLKKHLVVHVENGQLLSTSNDSLVKLNYMKALKYECFYSELKNSGPASSDKKRDFKFETLINGVSTFTDKKIRIKIFDKRYDKLLLENIFYYRE